MTRFNKAFSGLLTAAFCALLTMVGLTAFSSNASAKTGDLELSLSAGYNFGMARDYVNGHGFATSIAAGAKLNEYIGLYAEFNLNHSFANKSAQDSTGEFSIRKKDFFNIYSALISIHFTQQVYRSEFFEAIGLGFGATMDKFHGGDPGFGFASKASFGYLIHINDQFKLGIVFDALTNHKMEKNYRAFSADAQLITMFSLK